MLGNKPIEQSTETVYVQNKKLEENIEDKKINETPLSVDSPVEDKSIEHTTNIPNEPATAKEDKSEEIDNLDKVKTERVWRPLEKKILNMRDIIVGKVIVNITTGASGEPLEKAKTVLQKLVDQQPCERRAKQTIRTWGIRKGEPISCMVTLRSKKADEFLRKGFTAVGYRISPRSFDNDGNFAFGIKEHIDIPGQRYDPNLGIIGMDVIVNLERPGYRIKRKRRGRSRIGHSHRVTRDEAIEFIKEKYSVKVELPLER